MKQYHNRFCSECGREYHPNDQAIMCEGCGANNALPSERMRVRQEAIALSLMCAHDIVKAWPQTTIRTLGEMTKRMDTLHQALEAAGK